MTLNLRYLLAIVAVLVYTAAANMPGFVVPEEAIRILEITAGGSAGVTIASELAKYKRDK